MPEYDANPAHEVLIVDDDPASLKLTQLALEEIDAEIRTHVVRDGRKALDFLRGVGDFSDARRPDAIILDWNLPGLHGNEVLDEIKADPELRRIPVMVLSTSRRSEDIAAAYGAYANVYVAKEPDFETFIEVLRKIRYAWDVAEHPPK